MNNKTLILWDFDGVMNHFAVSRNLTGWTGEEIVERANVGEGSFVVSTYPDLIDAINEISDREDVDAHWLTTWVEYAPTVASPLLGIHGTEWPVLGATEYQMYVQREWWKLTALKNFLDKNPYEKVVWVDDDINFDKSARVWVKAGHPFRLLPICPDSNVALTKYHVRDIIKFIES